MEEKRIKEIERWLDRYVNRECSKMEAVDGIDAAYSLPEISDDEIYAKWLEINKDLKDQKVSFEYRDGYGDAFEFSSKWMRKKLTGK